MTGGRRTKAITNLLRLVEDRDGQRCVRCGRACLGTPGVDWSIHHRRIRGMGGDHRPDTDAPANLILLCGSGTTGCHGWVHSHRVPAEMMGWIVSRYSTPSEMPIRRRNEVGECFWALMDDDGGVVDALGEET